jgi:methylated-DNA-protein-cysteine methyltransferase-like protein
VKQATTFQRIRKIVSQIPRGKVATYGQIARLAGIRDARVVGWALRGNQDSKVPCHRVIKADGSLAADFSLGGWHEQKGLLKAEGIAFASQMKVNLKNHSWEP